MTVVSGKVKIPKNVEARDVFGKLDENVKIIETELDLSIGLEDSNIIITGEEKLLELGIQAIEYIIMSLESKEEVNKDSILKNIDSLIKKNNIDTKKILDYTVAKTSRGKFVKPKTLGQKRYLEAINNNFITFGIGPAGTGKTYLAIAMAAEALRQKEVDRIILTRPAVEAGENLGFLPGDLQDKVDPYLRPVYDALYDILGVEICKKYIERGIIEIAPLAYMRGRTLDSAYIILDEAQNSTNEQMKMILTRIGKNSKLVVTGDITQIDLNKKDSGLKNIGKILKNIKGIEFSYLTKDDIVRHHIVQKIIEAYERYDNKND